MHAIGIEWKRQRMARQNQYIQIYGNINVWMWDWFVRFQYIWMLSDDRLVDFSTQSIVSTFGMASIEAIVPEWSQYTGLCKQFLLYRCLVSMFIVPNTFDSPFSTRVSNKIRLSMQTFFFRVISEIRQKHFKRKIHPTNGNISWEFSDCETDNQTLVLASWQTRVLWIH